MSAMSFSTGEVHVSGITARGVKTMVALADHTIGTGGRQRSGDVPSVWLDR